MQNVPGRTFRGPLLQSRFVSFLCGPGLRRGENPRSEAASVPQRGEIGRLSAGTRCAMRLEREQEDGAVWGETYCDVSATAAGSLRFSFIEAASAVSLPWTVLAIVTASSKLP